MRSADRHAPCVTPRRATRHMLLHGFKSIPADEALVATADQHRRRATGVTPRAPSLASFGQSPSMITLITADLSSFLPVDPVVVVCPLPCLLPTPAREASTACSRSTPR